MRFFDGLKYISGLRIGKHALLIQRLDYKGSPIFPDATDSAILEQLSCM